MKPTEADQASKVFVNKRIFEDAKLRHAQVAFAAFHFTVTYVLLFVLSRPQIGLFEAKSVGKLTILPFAMAMIFNVVLPNASLAYSSIEFYQIARVLVTPCIVMLNYALYRLTITRQAAITLAPICVGVAVVSYFDTKPSGDLKSTSPLGVFFALGGVLVSGLYNIWIGRYHKSLELSSWQLLMNQAPVCVLVMLYIIPFSDDVTAFHSTALPSWILILLSGVFACLINLTHYFIVNEAGAVSASVVGHCKTCIIIIVGWISGTPTSRNGLRGVSRESPGVRYDGMEERSGATAHTALATPCFLLGCASCNVYFSLATGTKYNYPRTYSSISVSPNTSFHPRITIRDNYCSHTHNATMASSNTYLIWGKNGWIGGLLHDLLEQQGKNVHATAVRMHEQEQVRQILDEIKPTHVINCAGKTGRPNVDWCESHKLETMESNGLGTLVVAYECEKRNIHCTVLATGCIYTSEYNEDRSQLLGKPFTEDDEPNFTGSFYSATKAPIETLLKNYPNVLVLRLRMPVSSDLNPRSFVTKILAYPKVVNIPNSHSLLPNLLPIVVSMAEHAETGVYNFTNPGAISHNEVLQLYKDVVDPSYTWANFTLEEQAKVIVAERSNCELDSSKLVKKVEEYQTEGLNLEVPPIREAYRRCFEGMRRSGVIQQREGAKQELPVP
ncbi:hypothetical protein DOTSEDRAFT_80011 [Dothistroma septosporum NZE10]|uniref:RmlD-like substrate binding domain-containing protein n=1 Tax=Dothistroma septosporum (strain NZE10 / CBS 128990) TaxID=675120 RepID=N1PML0_DOTSN|nr:hypothetical protein DOTSEDRAFT_80011 [Dothistroma septosporum NZE10]